ncbi:MAG: Gfo/Idh/MocA family oxidoreductase [Akkermansiaceae bacterium]|jgi:predicted dehydrogenase
MKDSTPAPDRRKFLTRAASSAFGFTFIPAYLTSARAQNNPNKPPSQRLNVGCVGAGGRGVKVCQDLTRKGNATITAFADVDFQSARKIADNLKSFPKAKRFTDFREMYEKVGSDFDAVAVCTPDHTHFTAAIQAMSLGKHVYVEKPLTHTFEEAEILMRAEKKFKVVTQMGNQGHTSGGSEQFKRMVAGGVVDDVVKIDAFKGPGLWFMEAGKRIKEYPKAGKMPESLKSWDLWCGPRAVKDYHSLLHPFNWRAFHLYGSGMLGDWGCHIIDYVHHYLKLGYPTKITARKLVDHNQVIFPLSSELDFEFPERGPKLPKVTMAWKAGPNPGPPVAEKYQADPRKPVRVGGAGTLLHRKQEDYLVQRASHWSTSKLISKKPHDELKAAMNTEGPKFDHGEGFVQACMGNGKTESPFSVGAPLTQVLTLGVVAEYLNTDLEFDPKTKRFKGNDAANALLSGDAPRKDWADHYKLA